MDRRHAALTLAASLVGACTPVRVAGGEGVAPGPMGPAAVPPLPPLPGPGGEMGLHDPFWELVRAQYPLTRERVYLNTGGLGPASHAALDAMDRTMRELQRLSEHGHAQFDGARRALAAAFGCDADELAFTRNATEANATVALGLKGLAAGDEVLFDSHAHPGGAIPWMSRAKEQGIVCRTFDPDAPTPEAILQRVEAAITPRTKAVQVSHITAPTGIHLPVAEIAALCQRRGLWLHVDGAQSAGMIPLDLHALGCDSFGTSGHKWLGAPHGTGFLYVRKDRLDFLAPTEAGAYSDNGTYAVPDVLEYAPSARRFEPGTRDVSSVVGMAAAVALQQQIGPERLRDYGHALARRLAAGLRAIPGVTVLSPSHPALQTSITTFRLASVPYDRLYGWLLSAHKMRTRIVTEQGLNAVRVSTHVFNAASEVDALIAAVATAARSGVG